MVFGSVNTPLVFSSITTWKTEDTRSSVARCSNDINPQMVKQGFIAFDFLDSSSKR